MQQGKWGPGSREDAEVAEGSAGGAVKASSQVDDVACNAMVKPARRYDEKRAQERRKKKARSQSENVSSRAQEKRQGAGGGLRAIGQAGSGRLERSERRAHNLSTAVGWDSHTKA